MAGVVADIIVFGEGLERYFSEEVECDFIVWFCGGCACSFIWMQGEYQFLNFCGPIEDCTDKRHV